MKLFVLLLLVGCFSKNQDPLSQFKYGTKVEFYDNFYGLCTGNIISRSVYYRSAESNTWKYIVDSTCDTGAFGNFSALEENLRLTQ